MNSHWLPLLRALRDPATMSGFDPATWDRVVPMALWTGLLGRLGALARHSGVDRAIPPQVWRHMQAMLTVAEEQARAVRHELHHLTQALADLPGPVLLLKGAAYAAAGLPPARGRVFGDIDILVPLEQIGDAESALMVRGWQSQTRSAYDQRYYRRWMHEIPPMMHNLRRSVLDVHHAILPPTARIKTRPGPIVDAAVPVPGWPGLHVPCAEDLLLHSATHLFHEGESGRMLRDLVDIDALWQAGFGGEAGASRLWSRAEDLGLTRPLAVAARLRQRLLDREVPARLQGLSRIDRLASSAMASAMTTPCKPHADARSGLANALLYVRGHALRMPLGLLALHLTVKGWAHLRPPPSAARASQATGR